MVLTAFCSSLACRSARVRFHQVVDQHLRITDDEVEVRFHRRAHLPIISASGLLDEIVEVRWWDGARLRLTT